MIKEKGGRGRARAVLINFFPFLTYIYIYVHGLFTCFSPFIYGFATSFFERRRREGRSNKFDFLRAVAFDHRNSLGLQGRRLTKIYIIFMKRALVSIESIEEE